MKPQKEKKKRIWPKPAWLDRIWLDQRTKFVCLFVAVMAGILFFLYQYNMRYVRNLQYGGTIVTDREVFAQLQQGTAEIGSAVWLPHFAANEPLYRRGNHYYIGENHVRIQDGAPLLINDGTYVNLISGDGALIDAEWIRQPAMPGMYLSNGQSFNYDGTMADEEQIFFFHMDNGLYVNIKSLSLHGLLQDTEIPVNSFVHIDENGVRYFARQDSELLLYGAFTQVYDASVEIGGQTMSYQEFLVRLGIYKETDIQKRPEQETPEEDMTLPESQAGENEKESTSDAQLSLEDMQESQEEITDNADNRPISGGSDASYDRDDMTGDSVPGESGKGDENWESQENTQPGKPDHDEIPDRLPDNHRNKNRDTLPDRNENNGSNGTENSSIESGNGSESGNESSSGSGSESGNESSSGSGSGSGNENSSGGGSGSGNENSSGSGSGSGSESSSGSGSGSGEESSSGSGSGSGDESSSGSGSETKPTESESPSNPTRPTNPTNPTESLPVATDNNAGKPTLPVATDNNAGRPGDGESGDGGNSGPGGDSPSYDIEWKKPQVAISDLETDVYSCEGTLEVEDECGSFSRVILTMAWEDTLSIGNPNMNTEVKIRHTLKEKGEFRVDSLPPGKKIFVAAYLQYYDKDGKKVKEEKPFKTMVVKMKPFQEIDHIYLSFSDNVAHSLAGRYYEKQAGIYNLKFSAANGYLLNKAYRAEIKLYPYPEDDPNKAVTFRMSSNVLKRYMKEAQDYITSMSAGILKPGTVYRYEINVWDYFGNSFVEADKVCWGNTDIQTPSDYYKASGYDVTGNIYHPKRNERWNQDLVLGSQRFWGYTHTSKTLPTAEIRQIEIEEPQETLSKAMLSIKVEDIYKALITGGTGGSAIGGTPPENYKLYFALYSEEAGTEKGDELPVSLTKNDDGTVWVNGDNNGNRFWYMEKEALPGKAGAVYLIDGLTAGKAYMIRVFGSYDLDDNLGSVYDKELGNLRFGTTPLSVYGQMAYTISNRHIKTDQPVVDSYDHSKYESATAQELSVTINTKRTNPILAQEYFDRFYMELKDRKNDQSIIRLSFFKKRLKNQSDTLITVNEADLEDGYYIHTLEGINAKSGIEGGDYTYELLSEDMKKSDKLAPKVTMKIPVGALPESVFTEIDREQPGGTVYSFYLWDAFLSITDDKKFSQVRTELLLEFGEYSLKSYTNYVLSIESYATQGSVDRHNVTSPSSAFNQKRFTTLKEMPYITIGGSLQVGRYLYLVDIDLHDTDHSLYSRYEKDQVLLRNVNTVNNTTSPKYGTVKYDISSGGRIEEAYFDSLRVGNAYKLELLGVDIRRTGKTTSPRYQSEVLETVPYTVGEGVVGNLFMTGISHPVDKLTEKTESGTRYHTVAEYNKYEIGNFQYGSMSETVGEQITITRGERAYKVMDPIFVKPGQIYYLNRLNTNNNGTVKVAFLDERRNLAGQMKTVPSRGYLKVPEDEAIRYMQLSMYGDNIGHQAQVILVYDENDNALKNNLRMVSEEKRGTGNTVTFKKAELEQGDTIAMVSGEWINGGDGSFSITYQADNQEAVTLNNCRSGYAFLKPKNIQSLTVTVNGTLKDKDGNTIVPDIRVVDSGAVDIFSKYNYDTLIADYRAMVHDYSANKSLQEPDSGEVRVLVEAFDKDGVSAAAPKDAGFKDHTGANGAYEKTKSFQTVTGYTYRLSLEISWRGKWYRLDEQEFTATENEYSIATSNQMLKLAAWPAGKFRVIADLGKMDPYTVLSMRETVGTNQMRGTLDGQGHSLSVDFPSNSYGSFINVGDSGVIENMEFSFNLGDGTKYMRWNYPIGANYGIIRNTVFYVDFGAGNFRHEESAGVCGHNYNLIENFALYYDYGAKATGNNRATGTYMGTECGGLAYRNSGTIRNGVVYGERAIDVTTGVWLGSEDISLGGVGGLVGRNYSTGVIEQVLTVLNMRVERNKNVLDDTKAFNSYGLITGENSGIVRNCFTSGEMYYQTWYRRNQEVETRVNLANKNIWWPGCNSYAISSVKNCYYFSSGEYKISNENVKHLSGRDALKSPQFYGNTVNRNGGFVVESQLAGEAYPIVDMPACMDGRQKNIPLNATMPNSIPTYISSSVVRDGGQELIYMEGEQLSAETVAKLEETVGKDNLSLLKEFLSYDGNSGSATVINQFALVDVVISNLNNYKIADLEVNGLTVNMLSSENSEGLNTIRMFVTPYIKNATGKWRLSSLSESFSSSHTVKSFKYGVTGDSLATADVVNQSMNIDFYYPLSYETWEGAPRNIKTEAIKNNYRLKEDIVFKVGEGFFEDDSKMRNALNFFSSDGSSIESVFDGAGHSLDFEGIPGNQRKYYFREAGTGGTIKNLVVKNLGLAGGNGSDFVGLIGEAKPRSTLSDIHIRKAVIKDAYKYAGSLVAFASQNTIVNCTVVDVEITSGDNAYELYAGGLVGYRNLRSIMKNSFVRGLKMDTTAGNSVKGSGGLIGCDTSNSTITYPMITSCYAEGRIHTGFANAGGFLGRGLTRVTNAWSAVDIVGTNHVGGITGYAAALGVNQMNSHAGIVVSGELYASSETVDHRLVGYWQREPSTDDLWRYRSIRTYAYEGQLLNSSTSEERMDVVALSDSKTMMQIPFWNETAALGRFFCLSGTADIREITKAEVYPILYADDGETLLPDQTEIFYHVPQPAFNVVSAVAKDKGIDPGDPDGKFGKYNLEFTVEIGEELEEAKIGEYLKSHLKADGLDFTSAVYVSVAGAPKGSTYVKITGAKADRRLDSYRLIYEYGKDGKTVSTKLTFKESSDPEAKDVYLFWQIQDAAAWNEKVRKTGYKFENFMICGDIDFQNSPTIATSLKMNRLKGKEKSGTSVYDYRSKNWIKTPEFYSITGIELLGMNDAWIAEISNYMGYLDIRNCSVSSQSAIHNFGIIGTVNGNVEYVDFYNNQIKPASVNDRVIRNNIGCIANVQGTVEKGRICDVKVELSAGTNYMYSNVGGLVGYVDNLKEVSAFGTSYAPHDTDRYKCSYRIVMDGVGSTDVSGNAGNISNFGGAAGYVYINAQDIYGENLYVYGVNSIGALLGGVTSANKGGTGVEAEPCNIEVRSCYVRGRRYAGGAAGNVSSIGNIRHVRVQGVTVTANVMYAGGAIGYSGNGSVSDIEVYNSTVRSGGTYAGGVAGWARGIDYAKVASTTISAEENCAGGIVGGSYCTVGNSAVYNTEVSGNSYVGGVIGYNLNQRYTGTEHNIYHNVVSKVKVEGKNSDIGGVVGHTKGAQIYRNEVKQDVTVKGDKNCGGIAGYSSGGWFYQNIVGGTVEGATMVGGLAGTVLGYGLPPTAGADMDHKNARAYGNIIALDKIEARYSYVAGLIGQYIVGKEPVDGENKPIKDPNSPYVAYMSSTDFYGNAILAKNIAISSGNNMAYMHYYANYDKEYSNYITVLEEETETKRKEAPNYDCILGTLIDDKTMNSYLKADVYAVDGTEVGEGKVLKVYTSTLQEQSFYEKKNSEGGLGLKTYASNGREMHYFDYGDLKPANGTGYFPYICSSSEKLMPYQKAGKAPMGEKEDWNTYFTGSGISWAEKPYDGPGGIPIPAAATTANLRSVARGMVYPSGPDTINIDFSRIDNSLVNFDIEGEEEYLEKTAIDAVKDKAGVCSMSYDYQTDFVLNLYSLDGSVKETYVYYADNLRRTVMSWNGKNYYILSDGIYQGMEDGTSKKVLNGEFVNLYQGAALDSEGKVHELAPSSVPARVKKRAAEEELDEILSSAEAEEELEELLPSAEAEEVLNELLASDKPEEEPDQLLPFRESERDDEQKEENDAWSGPDSQSE